MEALSSDHRPCVLATKSCSSLRPELPHLYYERENWEGKNMLFEKGKICYSSQGRAEKIRPGQQWDLRRMTHSDSIWKNVPEVSSGTQVVSTKPLWAEWRWHLSWGPHNDQDSGEHMLCLPFIVF